MSSNALLLTNWYFPIKVLHWQTAICMLYKGTVDVVANYKEDVRSPSVCWKLPAVLRLKKPTPGEKMRIRYSRPAVYQRDRYCCQYCGERFAPRDLTLDHVIPSSRGGLSCFTNIVTACRSCNSIKDDRTCDEAGMFPLHWPIVPRKLPLRAPALRHSEVPDEWLPFVQGVML